MQLVPSNWQAGIPVGLLILREPLRTDLMDYDILELQETWLLHTPTWNDYNILLLPAIAALKGQPMSGLMVAAKINSGFTIQSWGEPNDFLQLVKICHHKRVIALINIYRNPSGITDSKFFRDLKHRLDIVALDSQVTNIVLAGDLNLCCLGDSSDHQINSLK